MKSNNMPGILGCNQLDPNDPAVVRRLLDAVTAQARDALRWSPLDVTGRYYFTTDRK